MVDVPQQLFLLCSNLRLFYLSFIIQFIASLLEMNLHMYYIYTLISSSWSKNCKDCMGLPIFFSQVDPPLIKKVPILGCLWQFQLPRKTCIVLWPSCYAVPNSFTFYFWTTSFSTYVFTFIFIITPTMWPHTIHHMAISFFLLILKLCMAAPSACISCAFHFTDWYLLCIAVHKLHTALFWLTYDKSSTLI